jgi:hypothetical protein
MEFIQETNRIRDLKLGKHGGKAIETGKNHTEKTLGKCVCGRGMNTVIVVDLDWPKCSTKTRGI